MSVWLKFIGSLCWALTGLYVAAMAATYLARGTYDVVPREKIFLTAEVAWGLMLLVCVVHVWTRARPRFWTVALPTLTTALFHGALAVFMILWSLDPMERGRSGGMVQAVALLSLLAAAALMPLAAWWKDRRP